MGWPQSEDEEEADMEGDRQGGSQRSSMQLPADSIAWQPPADSSPFFASSSASEEVRIC